MEKTRQSNASKKKYDVRPRMIIFRDIINKEVEKDKLFVILSSLFRQCPTDTTRAKNQKIIELRIQKILEL